MGTVYIESEKLWRSPVVEFSPHGLGYDILTTLKSDDQQRILEVNHETGRQFTVKDIYNQTITVAQNLQRLGVKKGDFVVLYSNINERITPIILACYTIGAPINFFETKFTTDEVGRVMEQIDPVVIIYEEVYKSRLFEALRNVQVPNIKHIWSIDSETSSMEEILFKPVGDIDSFEIPKIDDPTTHPAILMLTSGSTGFPKVNLHSHAMLRQNVDTSWQLSPSDIVFSLSAIRWISQVIFMLQPIFCGVQRIYTSKGQTGEVAREIIDTHKVTHTFMIPSGYVEMLKLAANSKNPTSLSSLKAAIISGEPFDRSLIDFSMKIAPNCNALNGYGMTELAGIIAIHELVSKKGINNGGAFVTNIMAKIIDDDGNRLGPGEKGRILLKKTVPFLGYLKNEEANKETFVDDGWIVTGDYGFIDSDNLIHVGTRYKYLLRSAGTIIIHTDVESVVNSHPNVVTSALIGNPDPENSINEIGTVFVVLKDINGSNNIEDELKNFVKDKLPKEQLQVIRHFRVIPKLLRTNSGKIDRIALKKLAKAAW